jgi:hypothetical protein
MNIERIRNLSPAENDLIHRWFQRAKSQSRCNPEDAFEPFIYCWIAFNGWYACTVPLKNDRDCVERIGSDAEIRRIFEELLEDREIREIALRFRKKWPIPNLRSNGRRFGDATPESALNLNNVLLQIYQVRNNLFHGGKSVEVKNDQDLVFFSFRILVRLLEKLLDLQESRSV